MKKSKQQDQNQRTSLALHYRSGVDLAEEDRISFTSINANRPFGLRDVSSNLSTLFNFRKTSGKCLVNTVANNKNSDTNDLIINGSLFDRELFQPSQSSYIIDYSNTSHWRNETSKYSPLDAHLFKLAFIITLSDGYVDKEILLGYYPTEDVNANIRDEISYYKRFCFPELDWKEKTSAQLFHDSSTFVFTRTLSSGQIEYGYCRRLTSFYNKIAKFPLVFCIVSSYPYFKLYDAILNELIRVYTVNEMECNLLLQSFYSKQLPSPNPNSPRVTCILKDRRVFCYTCPNDSRLGHNYYFALLSALSPNLVVHLFDAMLCSKRIIVFSRCASKLTKCCLGLIFLLSPLTWPYSFVSLLPTLWLSDLIDSPCPYIYGCLRDTINKESFTWDHDTILVDLDSNTIEDFTDGIYLLPIAIRKTFESSLEYIIKYRLIKLNPNIINVAVSEACLQVFVELLYRLPDFLKPKKISLKNSIEQTPASPDSFKHNDSGIDLQSVVSIDSQTTILSHDEQLIQPSIEYEFHDEEFLRVQPTSYAPFLERFVHGMMFSKFIDDYQRIDNHNNNDVFALFTQRLSERRQLTHEDLSISPLIRFQRTFDLLVKQSRQMSKQTNPTVSKFLKSVFE